MRITVQVVGIATTFFWLFLIIFSVSVIYSLKDVRLNFGQPQITMTEEKEMLLSIPIEIINAGYYDIDQLSISSRVTDRLDLMIAEGYAFIPSIGRGASAKTTQLIPLNTTDILRNHQDFLFEDAELKVQATMAMIAAEFIPIQVSTNLSIPWRASLYNLPLGSRAISGSALSSLTSQYNVTVPMSFENHACFAFEGTALVGLCNEANDTIAEREIEIKAPQRSEYYRSLEFNMPAAHLTRYGHIAVSFSMQLFNSEPLEVGYGN